MQLLMNSYRVPLPASAIQQYTVDASHTLWTWSYSSRLSGIPAADQFEVEIVHLLSNQVLSLPCSLRLNCWLFLDGLTRRCLLRGAASFASLASAPRSRSQRKWLGRVGRVESEHAREAAGSVGIAPRLLGLGGDSI